MADTIQDVGVKGIMGARWLLGGMRRLGKATSSVVVFLDRKLALGSHLKVRDAGYRLKPTTSTEEGEEWNAVIGDGGLLVLAYTRSLSLRLVSFLLIHRVRVSHSLYVVGFLGG